VRIVLSGRLGLLAALNTCASAQLPDHGAGRAVVPAEEGVLLSTGGPRVPKQHGASARLQCWPRELGQGMVCGQEGLVLHACGSWLRSRGADDAGAYYSAQCSACSGRGLHWRLRRLGGEVVGQQEEVVLHARETWLPEPLRLRCWLLELGEGLDHGKEGLVLLLQRQGLRPDANQALRLHRAARAPAAVPLVS